MNTQMHCWPRKKKERMGNMKLFKSNKAVHDYVIDLSKVVCITEAPGCTLRFKTFNDSISHVYFTEKDCKDDFGKAVRLWEGYCEEDPK